MSGGRGQINVGRRSSRGLHMRPETGIGQGAARFVANVRVCKEGRCVDGKNAWDMMTLLSPPGTILTFEAEGPDAPAVLEAMVAELQRWNEIDAAADVQG